MKIKWMIRLMVGAVVGGALAAVLVLAGGAWAYQGREAAVDAAPAGELSAQEVVDEFYAWYLAQFGEPPYTNNPLVDRTYRDSEFLAPAFVAQVDELLDSWARENRHSGYDPFLLAQDIPVRVEAVESALSGDTAQVTVHMFWGGNPVPSERTVTLERSANGFLITGVTADW